MTLPARVWLLCLAHTNTTSVGELILGDSTTELRLTVDADRMLQSVGSSGEDGTLWTPEEVEERAPTMLEYVTEHYLLRVGDEPCPLTPLDVQPVIAFDSLIDRERLRQIQLRFALPHRTGDYRLTLRENLFAQLEPFHTHVFQVDYGKGVASLPVAPEEVLTIPVEDPSREGFLIRTITYFEDGARRLVDRPEFLLFLLVAMLGMRRVPRVLGAVAAAALGASVTYALAAARLLTPSEHATALAVAFSVVYLAAENLLSRDQRHRWITALLFGLVHGLSLASLLLARGLPLRGRTAAILAFQGGLLLGLVLFVAVTLPLVLWLARPTSPRRLTLRGLNAVAALAGVSLAFL